MPAMLEASSATLLALDSRDGEKGRAAAHTFNIARVYTGWPTRTSTPYTMAKVFW